MPLSRRQLLKRGLVGATLLSMPKSLLAASREPLNIPPLLDIRRGRPLRLDLSLTQTRFEQKWVEAWGVNGQYLAPTVRVKSGDFIKLTYHNNLPQAVSIGIQGLQAASEMMNSTHRPLAPQSSWSPILSVNQPACSCFYHADTLFHSAFQTYRGLAGLWLIDDEASVKSVLPNKYGVNDIPLILQDQDLNNAGEQLFNPQQTRFFGKRLLVNGQESPYLNVPRGWIRLRLVNASLSRHYELCLDNDQPLHLIATGGGMLAQAVELPSLLLAPCERAEVLIDLNQGENVALISGQKRHFFYPLTQLFSNGDELADNLVLELRPDGLMSLLTDKPSLPAVNAEDFNIKPIGERQFVLHPSAHLINQRPFDPQRLDFTAKLGSTERWKITTHEAVGFCIQGAKFIIESQNGKAFSPDLLAWRDVIWLEPQQTTTLLVRFENPAPDHLPFTYGVSDLMLRDKGAMGQFSVK